MFGEKKSQRKSEQREDGTTDLNINPTATTKLNYWRLLRTFSRGSIKFEQMNEKTC